MIDFSQEELEKIAQLTSLQLDTAEFKELARQLTMTLEYLQELDTFHATVEHEAIRTINVFREDKPIPFDSTPT